MNVRTFLAAALLCVLMTHAADARSKHRHSRHFAGAGKPIGCSDPAVRPCNVDFSYRRGGRKNRHALPPGLHRILAEGAGRVVGGRPRGCPRRYCGCGASLYIFGRIIPRLNLAANWLRFPRAAPAPGMVAARRGHVFVLKRHIRGRVWLVHDSIRAAAKPASIAGQLLDLKSSIRTERGWRRNEAVSRDRRASTARRLRSIRSARGRHGGVRRAWRRSASLEPRGRRLCRRPC